MTCRSVATLWKKEGENGVFFNTTISRTYKDGETFKDTNSFSGAELLKVSRIAAKAYDLELQLKAEARAVENEKSSDGASSHTPVRWSLPSSGHRTFSNRHITTGHLDYHFATKFGDDPFQCFDLHIFGSFNGRQAGLCDA